MTMNLWQFLSRSQMLRRRPRPQQRLHLKRTLARSQRLTLKLQSQRLKSQQRRETLNKNKLNKIIKLRIEFMFERVSWLA